MNRKEIIETMEQTKGSVLTADGRFFTKPEAVPPEEELAAGDPISEAEAAEELNAQIRELQARRNTLLAPRVQQTLKINPESVQAKDEEIARLKAELEQVRGQTSQPRQADAPVTAQEGPQQAQEQPPEDQQVQEQSPEDQQAQESPPASQQDPEQTAQTQVAEEPAPEEPRKGRFNRR